MNKNIWGRIGSIGLLFILNRETEKTSLVDGGPYKSHLRLSCKASGLQRRRALKLVKVQSFITSSSDPSLFIST